MISWSKWQDHLRLKNLFFSNINVLLWVVQLLNNFVTFITHYLSPTHNTGANCIIIIIIIIIITITKELITVTLSQL